MNTAKVFIFAALVRLFPKKEIKKDGTTVKAAFSFKTESLFRHDTEIAFRNDSENATDYVWDFGDGNISTEEHPVHSYGLSGEYKIKLIAMSDMGSDSFKKIISIK